MTNEVIAGYILEVESGGTAISLPLGSVLSFSAAAPDGIYFVRIVAQTASGARLLSREVQVATGQSLSPLPPGALLATVIGNNVTLQWTENPLGPAVKSYQLEAGSAPGLADVAVAPVPATARTFAAMAPTGTYYVRLRAANAAGVGPASSEVTVRTGPGVCTAPAMPTDFVATPRPGGVTLAWSAPISGGIPTGYRLEVGSTTGGSNIGSFPLPVVTTIAAPAPSGGYFVRVTALNACGASAPSEELSFVIP